MRKKQRTEDEAGKRLAEGLLKAHGFVVQKCPEPAVAQVHRQTAPTVIREPGAREQNFDYTEVLKALQPTHVMHFRDDGQDFLRWYLAANGVVVCSEPFQTAFWAGTVVLRHLINRRPVVRTRDGSVHTISHTVTSFEELNNG